MSREVTEKRAVMASQVSAPPPVAWRLTVAGPRLGVALDLAASVRGPSAGDSGSPGVLVVAVRNAVVAMQDTLEVLRIPKLVLN
jgi:hypothetical protein